MSGTGGQLQGKPMGHLTELGLFYLDVSEASNIGGVRTRARGESTTGIDGFGALDMAGQRS